MYSWFCLLTETNTQIHTATQPTLTLIPTLLVEQQQQEQQHLDIILLLPDTARATDAFYSLSFKVCRHIFLESLFLIIFIFSLFRLFFFCCFLLFVALVFVSFSLTLSLTNECFTLAKWIRRNVVQSSVVVVVAIADVDNVWWLLATKILGQLSFCLISCKKKSK